MSDSDSDDVTARASNAPSASKIEDALRSVVKELQRADRSDELTVNSVRTAAGERLGLKTGFFKNGSWKDKSKDIIRDQADKEPDSAPASEAGSGSESEEERASRGKKRKATEANLPKSSAPHKSKTRKTNQDSDDDLSDVGETEDEDAEKSEADAKRVKNGSEAEASDESPLSDIDSEEPAKSRTATKANANDSESEMSILDDGDPPPKKRGRKKSTDAKVTKPKKAEKAEKSGKAGGSGKVKNEAASSGPDQEEIKKLQGWLVKCGIRKLWGKELAPYEGGKAKIRHLRAMLADAGMSGRFSADKARQIKEARELAADLEAVQEGNKMWGKDSDDDEDGDGEAGGGGKESGAGGRPRKRLAKGLKELDFISDGEETD